MVIIHIHCEIIINHDDFCAFQTFGDVSVNLLDDLDQFEIVDKVQLRLKSPLTFKNISQFVVGYSFYCTPKLSFCG